MALFKEKKTYFGIDLGTGSIKVVELQNLAGRPTLVTYGLIEQSGDIVKNATPETQKRIVSAIRKLLKRSKVSGQRAVASLPNYTVFSSVINLPAMSKRDLAQAVRWEAKKFVPMPIDEMVLDWQVLSPTVAPEREATEAKGAPKKESPAGGRKTTNVLLTAAPKNLVGRYLELFKTADIQLLSLETESFALERSLIGHDKSAIMIVDIGALNTNISVMLSSVPLINRSIDVGGDSITRAIAGSLNVDTSRAEQFKRDFGITAAGSATQVPKTIEFVISSIINEIRYVLNLYQNQNIGPSSRQNGIEKVILSGGTAYLPGLVEYLSQMLNMRVFIGNPWSRVAYPEELTPVLGELGGRFAVAVGLALRELA